MAILLYERKIPSTHLPLRSVRRSTAAPRKSLDDVVRRRTQTWGPCWSCPTNPGKPTGQSPVAGLKQMPLGGWALPLRKNMSSSIGMMTFPSEWKNEKCSKPPTRMPLGWYTAYSILKHTHVVFFVLNEDNEGMLRESEPLKDVVAPTSHSFGRSWGLPSSHWSQPHDCGR